jgi:hypothetical protein
MPSYRGNTHSTGGGWAEEMTPWLGHLFLVCFLPHVAAWAWEFEREQREGRRGEREGEADMWQPLEKSATTIAGKLSPDQPVHMWH